MQQENGKERKIWIYGKSTIMKLKVKILFLNGLRHIMETNTMKLLINLHMKKQKIFKFLFIYINKNVIL